MPRTTRRSSCGARSPGCRRAGSSASRPPTISGRWAIPARAAPARRSSSTTAPTCRAAPRAAPTPTATASSRSGTSCSCSSSSRPGDRLPSAAPLDRHRHGARAHRRRAAGPPRQLRHRPVPGLIGASAALTGARAEGASRPSHKVIADHLRAGLPAGRRRHAVQRGPRLRAAADHAPRHAPRPAAGRAEPLLWRIVPVLLAEMGKAFPELLPRRGADHRGAEARGDQLPAHAGARPEAARGGDRPAAGGRRRCPATSRSGSTTRSAFRST